MTAVILLSIGAGVIGTIIGALVETVIGKTGGKAYKILLCAAGGMMLSLVAFDLIPESLEQATDKIEGYGILYLLAFVLLGLAVAAAADYLICKHSHFHNGHASDGECKRNTPKTTGGVMMIIALCLHNLPEGFALGAAVNTGLTGAVIMAVLIAAHNIPGGVALVSPYRKGGVPVLKRLLIAGVTGIPTVIGAVTGYLISGINPLINAAAIAFAAGILLYIIFHELLPEAYSGGGGIFNTVVTVLSVLIGFTLITLV